MELTFRNSCGDEIKLRWDEKSGQITFNHSDLHEKGRYEEFSKLFKVWIQIDEEIVFHSFLRLCQDLALESNNYLKIKPYTKPISISRYLKELNDLNK